MTKGGYTYMYAQMHIVILATHWATDKKLITKNMMIK